MNLGNSLVLLILFFCDHTMYGQSTIPDRIVLDPKLGYEYLAVAMQAYGKLSRINDSTLVKSPTYIYTNDLVIDGMVHEISICSICPDESLICDVRIYSSSTHFPKRIIYFRYNYRTTEATLSDDNLFSGTDKNYYVDASLFTSTLFLSNEIALIMHHINILKEMRNNFH